MSHQMACGKSYMIPVKSISFLIFPSALHQQIASHPQPASSFSQLWLSFFIIFNPVMYVSRVCGSGSGLIAHVAVDTH